MDIRGDGTPTSSSKKITMSEGKIQALLEAKPAPVMKEVIVNMPDSKQMAEDAIILQEENLAVSNDKKGTKKQLSQEIKHTIRRERNKLHAKATRERKKAFLEMTVQCIQQVEKDNRELAKLLGEKYVSISDHTYDTLLER